MKSQDFYLALYFWGAELQQQDTKQVSDSGLEASIRVISSESGIPLGSCHRSLTHLLDIGLVSADQYSYRPNTRALSGILIHAVRYFFPVRPGALARGVPTAHSAPFWANKLVGGEDMLVWPHAQGNIKGVSIEPLHPGAIEAALRLPKLYHLLSVCDMFRLGGVRDIEQAKVELKDMGGTL